MSPSDIEVLIHFHVCPDPHPRTDAPAVIEAVDTFLSAGLIEKRPGAGNEECYMTTSRGRAHIGQLCNTIWPQQAWIDQTGKIIEI